MHFKQLIAKTYAVILYLIAAGSTYYMGVPLFFHEGFWGSRDDLFSNAVLFSALYILFLIYLTYLGYRLFIGNYPRFLAVWVALPYVLLLTAIGMFAYILVNTAF